MKNYNFVRLVVIFLFKHDILCIDLTLLEPLISDRLSCDKCILLKELLSIISVTVRTLFINEPALLHDSMSDRIWIEKDVLERRTNSIQVLIEDLIGESDCPTLQVTRYIRTTVRVESVHWGAFFSQLNVLSQQTRVVDTRIPVELASFSQVFTRLVVERLHIWRRVLAQQRSGVLIAWLLQRRVFHSQQLDVLAGTDQVDFGLTVIHLHSLYSVFVLGFDSLFFFF